ncbi:C-type lectin domain family 4 member E-like isoform X1, partial [Biomphalaria glabrata]
SVDCKQIIAVTYNGMSDVRYGAPRLGNHWKAPTLASCLVACRSYYSSCYSVVFNVNTRNCTP